MHGHIFIHALSGMWMLCGDDVGKLSPCVHLGRFKRLSIPLPPQSHVQGHASFTGYKLSSSKSFSNLAVLKSALVRWLSMFEALMPQASSAEAYLGMASIFRW